MRRLAILAVLPFIAACVPQRSAIDLTNFEFVKFTDDARHEATTLINDYDDDAKIDLIEFGSEPNSIETQEPDPVQPVATVAAGASDEKLDRILEEIESLKRSQLTKEDVREVVHDELEVFRRLLIEWKDSSGKVSKTAASVDSTGVGSVELPPGAIVTAMGGVPIDQWKVANLGATVSDGSLGKHSNGGAVSSGGSTGTVRQSMQQVSVPLSVATWESEVVTPVQYYSSPGQFQSSVAAYDDYTKVKFQVAREYLPPAAVEGSGCYQDANGNTVCPNAGSTHGRTGLFQRLRSR
jgi:hypothetical protein